MSMKTIIEGEYITDMKASTEKWLDENLPDYTRNHRIIIEIIPI